VSVAVPVSVTRGNNNNNRDDDDDDDGGDDGENGYGKGAASASAVNRGASPVNVKTEVVSLFCLTWEG